MKFSFIDLFSGIGGFRIAFEKLGGKCLGFSEIDSSAIKTYKANFVTTGEIEFGNVLNIQKLPNNIDILSAGIPCQPWSVAGSLQRFNDKRGILWFDVIRLIENSQPKSFIIENVAGLILPSNRHNFEFLLGSLENCGYSICWQLMNSYDYGIPQDRKRVFIVGIRKDINHSFKFPCQQLQPKLIDIFDKGEIEALSTKNLENEVDFFIFSDVRGELTTIHSWDITETTPIEQAVCVLLKKARRDQSGGEKDGHPVAYSTLKAHISELSIDILESLISKKILKKIGDKYEFINSKNMVGINGIYKIILPTAKYWPTLTATKSHIFMAKKNICPVTKANFIANIYSEKQYMPLGVKHLKRLQGFPDDFVLGTKLSAAQKQLGNSVTVPVVQEITQAILKTISGDRP